MNASSPPSDVRAAKPEMVRRLLEVVGPLAALVGAELALRPTLWGLIRPLRNWIMHIARRFGAVRVPPVTRKSHAGAVKAEPATVETRKTRVRLPGRRGWLIDEVGPKAAIYKFRLELLLDDPAMRAVIDAAPGFGRVLRPLCWMLGISRDKARSKVELAVVTVDAEGRAVPRKVERPWPRPGKMQAVQVIMPPVEPVPRIPPEVAWNFAKYR